MSEWQSCLGAGLVVEAEEEDLSGLAQALAAARMRLMGHE